MNKWEKEVARHQLTAEQAVIKELEAQYKRALNEINLKIRILKGDDLTQSKIYQINYQEALKGQIEGILEKLHGDEFTSIQEYLKECYTDGFIGTMYDIAGQGIPLMIPIDQNAAVKAIMTDSKINEGLYKAIGVDTAELKKRIRSEITRGLAANDTYESIAQSISLYTNAPLARARTIVRTEGHRIQQASTEDARQAAKKRGCDVLKVWDATLDGKTRPAHRKLDGQIRETDEFFEMDGKKARHPGDFGRPEEDCNCRCAANSIPRWALDEAELEEQKERAKFFGVDKTEDFEEYKKKYLKAVEKEAEKVAVPLNIEQLQEYSESILKKHDITVNVKGSGRYLKEAKENVELLDNLLTEYQSTLKSFTISSASMSNEGGSTIYLTNSASGMRIPPSAFNPKARSGFRNVPDAKNHLVVTTHEFAHTLTKQELEKDASFWKEVGSVRTKYRKALKEIERAEYVTHTITAAEAMERKQDIFISDYANKTLDEFLAESFAQAKLSETPSPYAMQILEIVNKYFGKKK